MHPAPSFICTFTRTYSREVQQGRRGLPLVQINLVTFTPFGSDKELGDFSIVHC